MKLISQLSCLGASQGKPDRDLGEASSVLLVVLGGGALPDNTRLERASTM